MDTTIWNLGLYIMLISLESDIILVTKKVSPIFENHIFQYLEKCISILNLRILYFIHLNIQQM
jgi:hypothetical protein